MMQKQSSEYRAIHHWVERYLGKPAECWCCGNSGSSRKRYEWANVSGEYQKDLQDWARLCTRCHVMFDGKNAAVRRWTQVDSLLFRDTCANNHHLTLDKLFLKKYGDRTPSVECRDCRRAQVIKFRNKQKGILCV